MPRAGRIAPRPDMLRRNPLNLPGVDRLGTLGVRRPSTALAAITTAAKFATSRLAVVSSWPSRSSQNSLGRRELSSAFLERPLQAEKRTATRHYRAVLGYAPRPYHGDLWLFRSEDDRYPP